MFLLPRILLYSFFVLAVGVQAAIENFNLQCRTHPPQYIPVPSDCLVAIDAIPALRLDHHATEIHGSPTLSYPPIAGQVRPNTIFYYGNCAVLVRDYSPTVVMTSAERVYMYWLAVKFTAMNILNRCVIESQSYGWEDGRLTIDRPSLPYRISEFGIVIRNLEQAELEAHGSRTLYVESGVGGSRTGGGGQPAAPSQVAN